MGELARWQKLFLDTNDVFIGKTLFVHSWLCDEARSDRNALCLTDIKQAAINLDKWIIICFVSIAVGFGTHRQITAVIANYGVFCHHSVVTAEQLLTPVAILVSHQHE